MKKKKQKAGADLANIRWENATKKQKEEAVKNMNKARLAKLKAKKKSNENIRPE